MDLSQFNDIRVLIVDDDDDDWLIIRKMFRQITEPSFIVERASTYEEALKAIEAGDHDVYLIDYRLGEHTGTDILEQVHPERRSQPFILLTGVADTDLERRSLRLAAADYLVKGSFDATMLSRTLLYALQRKLIEQQRVDQLIELNQAKEDFISIASHQLRTPATGVKQYLGMVVEGFVGEVPKEQLALLKQAYRSNERQLRIINDLLKVAQVDSGKMKLHLEPVQIDELIDEVLDEQRAVLDERGQVVEFKKCDSKVPTIKFDRDSIRMVFENLVDNASKYSPDGSTICIEIDNHDSTLGVSVHDEGVGIIEEDLSRLFEKFVRLDNPFSTKVGGTGLGLYWAKRIVDMHGGRIDYRPNHPKGSVFTVVLPKSGARKSERNHTTELTG
jgi:signal transduction histidine kinase